jgi:hypothetical protein
LFKNGTCLLHNLIFLDKRQFDWFPSSLVGISNLHESLSVGLINIWQKKILKTFYSSHL